MYNMMGAVPFSSQVLPQTFYHLYHSSRLLLIVLLFLLIFFLLLVILFLLSYFFSYSFCYSTSLFYLLFTFLIFFNVHLLLFFIFTFLPSPLHPISAVLPIHFHTLPSSFHPSLLPFLSIPSHPFSDPHPLHPRRFSYLIPIIKISIRVIVFIKLPL